MYSYQPVNNHQDLMNIVDGLLLEAGVHTCVRPLALDHLFPG